MAQRIVTYTCVPYEWNWSQDVEKCTLDLVLSWFTHTNAVQLQAPQLWLLKVAGFSCRTPYYKYNLKA